MSKKIKISEVCEFQSGLWKGKKGPFLQANVIRNTNFRPQGKLSYENIALLDVAEKELSKRQLQHGDIILEKSGGGEKTPVGRVALFEKQENKIPFSLSNFTCFIRIKKPSILNYNYLHKFLNFIYESGKTESMQKYSTGIRNLQLKKYKDISLTLPSIAEQRQIVEQIDLAFSMIYNNQKRLKEKIKNLVLFEQNVLNEILNKLEIKKYSFTLNQLLELGYIESHLDGNHGSFYPRKAEFIDKGVPYISANCISGNDVLMTKAKYLSVERAEKFKKGVAKNGDVLFAHNATVGPSTILKTKHKKVILGTSLTYYRCNKEKIINEYLLTYMRSNFFIKQYKDVMRQATRNQVPITKQREFDFLIPPLKIQIEIIKKATRISELVKKLIILSYKKENLLSDLRSKTLFQKFQFDEVA